MGKPWHMNSNFTKLQLWQGASRAKVAYWLIDPTEGYCTTGAGGTSVSPQKQSHHHCPHLTKFFCHCSKIRIIGPWDVSIIPSVRLRPLYPLHEQTPEVHTHGTFLLQFHLVFVPLHHSRSTASTSEYAGSHSHWDDFLGPSAGLHCTF